MDPSDLEAIERGYRLRSDQIAKRLLAELEPESITALNECARSRFELVTWLVAQNHLDFKIANVTHSANQGIYHEKIGLFRDDWRNEVAFSGSSNESISGISLNFESFNVFRSWVSKDIERLQEHREDFEDLWSDRTPGLEVIELPEAVKKRLIELAPDELPREIIPHRRLPPHPGTEVTIGDELYGFPVRPSSVVLYEHQREALRAWIDAGSQGVLSMATGTGKTLTALSGMSAMAAALRQADRPLFVLIVAPYKILVRQWATQAGNFGADSLLCYDSASKWVEQLSERLRAIRQGFAPFALAITTTATFSGPWMKEAMQQAPKDFLVIADEVHNLGSDTALKALPDNASMRIGLSATPDRHLDPQGTKGIKEYFGETVFNFSLKNALSGGFLSKYYYRPVLVNFTLEEAEKYVLVCRKIARLLGTNDPTLENLPNGPLKTLLFERARLIGGAQNKISALRTAIAPYRKDANSLIYCSDASLGIDGSAPQRQLDAVVRMLGGELGMHVHSYTSDEDESTRITLEQRFKNRDLQALVAIRCLDEGVDLPSVRRAFILASSTNPRQFIQRRGRVLRNAPGKEYAEIFDFAVVPPEDSDPSLFSLERRLFKRELQRMSEFAEHAMNGQQAFSSLLDLQKRYHLLDI
ncbi:DEAD/DEAH box helicase family protein [Actinomadura luteofluorescens]|uniref:DEAD/DEAH box helicase family protein n=1 Tax=Actinomadura luteofluorescens TaxID=46163 RepID=UPI001C538815|nr:DEAD/DEAH box helicase family protein [Actinomadura luteofluorescens]